MCPVLKALNVIPIFLFSISIASAQMTSQSSNSGPYDPMELITEVFLGMGVEVLSVEFDGDDRAVGSFEGGSDVIGIDNGLVMTTGRADSEEGPHGPAEDGWRKSGEPTNSQATDIDIDSIIAPTQANDVQVYNIKFIPSADTLKFNYVWASEEYPEFTCSNFNDGFGFFLSGPGINGPFENNAINIAMIPGSDFPVSINTINGGEVGQNGNISNCTEPEGSLEFDHLYVVGPPFDQPIYDGFTVPLTALATVIPCEEYTMKIVIADAVDDDFDSAVFLEQGSLNSEGQVGFEITYVYDEAVYEGCEDQVCVNFFLTESQDSFPIYIALDIDSTSTAEIGVDFDAILDTLYIESELDTVQWCIDVIDNPGLETLETIQVGLSESSLCDRSVFPIYIDQAPEVSTSILADSLACPGDTVNLGASLSEGLGELNYNWSTGDSTSLIETVAVNQNQYSLTVTDVCGNSALSSWSIKLDTLTAGISGPDFACSGDEVQLSVISSGMVDSYVWSTGDSTATISVVLGNAFDFRVTVSGCNQVELEWNISDEMCCSLPIAHYDLNECLASPGETAVYNEFTAVNLCPMECASTESSFIFRSPASTNRHSCTPGFVSKAMCVSALEECEYLTGDQKSVLFELEIVPDESFAVRIDSLSFYELAPEMYDWINGSSGINNYPSLYGFRIVDQNNITLYEESDIPTTQDWTKEKFIFDSLVILEPSTLRFELLAYCPVNNEGPVSVWDLDEISVFAGCLPAGMLNGLVTGKVKLHSGEAMDSVLLVLDHEDSEGVWLSQTTESGEFLFPAVPFEGDYTLIPFKDGDYMNGLSTYDIVITQKHLIGRVPFTSPYQYVAADMNGNYSVTALDIVMMRKLILGHEADNSYLDEWRFIESSAELELDHPFNFEGVITLENVKEDKIAQDFVAVKMGDVSGEVELILEEQVESRQLSSIELLYDVEHISEGSVIHIHTDGAPANSIEGLQLCFEGSFYIESNQIPLSIENYHQKDRNTLVSWNGSEDLSSNEPLLTLRTEDYIDQLKLRQRILQSEWVAKGELFDITLGHLEKTDFDLEVFPNPFDGEVQFKLANATNLIELEIYNSLGQQIFSKVYENQAQNTFEISLDCSEFDDNASMLFYQCTSGQITKKGTLIRAR